MRRYTTGSGRTRRRTVTPPLPIGAVGYWSNPVTWGGSLPVDGDPITIGAGQTVVLDCATPSLAALDIPGTLLVDPTRDVAITAASINVGSTGRFQIGAEGAPYVKKATITLTGSESGRADRFVPDIASTGGTGNGTLRRLAASTGAVAENITVTFSSATDFTVSGSVSGSLGSGTVGTLFNNKVRFIATAGTTAWANGATVTIGLVKLGFTNNGMGRSLQVQPGGKLILIGNPPLVTRTKVSAAVVAGVQSLTLADAVTWPKMDRIIVGPTDYYGTASGLTERLFARETSAASTTVTARAAPSAGKWGHIQYATDAGLSLTPGTLTNTEGVASEVWDLIPKSLDQRAPIVNLTRNIVIQGAADAAWQNRGFGAHCMWMGRTSEVKIDGVEFRRVGQAGALGRYPIHWHMMSYNMPDGMGLPSDGTFLGEATGQYVKRCSIHESSQRAIVIHGTHGVTVDQNVCYDITAHAIFLEDGCEKNNTITNNTVIKVRPPSAANKLLNHDFGSGYWYSNPANTFHDNWAADCASVGIWNAWANRCFGLSVDIAENANMTPVLVHRDNMTHSNGALGMQTELPAINNRGDRDGLSYNIDGFELTGQRVWKNRGGGYNNRIHQGNYSGWVQADNEAMDFFGASINVSTMERMLLVGESLNNASNNAAGTRRCAMASYHELLVAKNCVAINYPLLPPPTPVSPYTNDLGVWGANNPALQGSGFIRTGDLYTDGEFSFAGFQGLKFINTDFGFRTKPPNLDGLPLDWSGKKRHYTFAGAIRDVSNLAKNGADKTYVFNESFFTHDASDLVDWPATGPYQGVNGKRTTSRFYSVNCYTHLGLPGGEILDMFELNVDRLDASNNVVGNWLIGSGVNSFGSNMRHFAGQRDGKYRIRFGAAYPNDYMAIRFNYMTDTANDVITVGVQWDGATPVARVFVSNAQVVVGSIETPAQVSIDAGFARMYNNTGMTSINDVHADTTGTKYWVDVANNLVWVRVKNTPNMSNPAPRKDISLWIFAP